METPRKRVAMVLARNFEDVEATEPKRHLEELGAEVTVIGIERGPIEGKKGATIEADATFADVSPDEFDLLVIPGGFAPDYLRRSEAVLRLVSGMAERGKLVAAVCHGPWVLCSTQALKGKKATCFFAIKDDVQNAGARYVDAEVVRDGNLITSRKPDDLPAFLQTIIQALREQKPARAMVEV